MRIIIVLNVGVFPAEAILIKEKSLLKIFQILFGNAVNMIKIDNLQ